MILSRKTTSQGKLLTETGTIEEHLRDRIMLNPFGKSEVTVSTTIMLVIYSYIVEIMILISTIVDNFGGDMTFKSLNNFVLRNTYYIIFNHI